jgi:hypothetical protein
MPRKPKSTDQDTTKVILKLSGNPKKKQKKMQVLLRKRRGKYGVGTHGSAKFQRKTLGTTGDEHESEHVVGYNVYAQDYDRKHGEGKQIEMGGLAYLEVKALHRDHPGTGSGQAADVYRDTQRSILDEGKSNPSSKTISTAIQFNQLEYAHQSADTKQEATDEEMEIAAISYEAMVRNGQSLTYYDGTSQTSFQLDQVQRAELLLAYEVRMSGQWPTQDRIKEVIEQCGLTPIVQNNIVL